MGDRDEKGQFLPEHTQPGPGRTSSYDPSMNEAARKLALLGMTDEDIATFFGVSEKTINNWKVEYPAFFQSLNEGKTIADAEVAESLYRRAKGEVVFIEKRVKNDAGEYEIIRLSQQIPADPGAAKLWLTNRQGRLWREKSHVEQSGEVTHVHRIERKIVDANPTD